MTWPVWTSMLGPWQWAALGAVVPAIISLYFLKLKRRSVEVPSTYLWQKSIEDLHVNSIWQKLRQSLLLLLQLLLLAVLMLALLSPSFKGAKLTGGRYIFLVDNSASMSASMNAAEMPEKMPGAIVAMNHPICGRCTPTVSARCLLHSGHTVFTRLRRL